MKYVVLVSHGTLAPGLHNALSMLAGEDREDILSTSLENGMGSDVYAENLRKLISVIKPEDEIILFGDLVGGSPLTTAANVIAEQGLLDRTVMIGGMNMPLALTAVLSKDDMDTSELVDMVLEEGRENLKIFEVENSDEEEEL